MSTATDRRPLAAAAQEAQAFREMFRGFDRGWTIAGSIRRQRETVGDVEHVFIGDEVFLRLDEFVFGAGLFVAPKGEISIAIYPDGRRRWGDLYRGVLFRGFRHELFRAHETNLGAILTIRTGPADFSRRLVTQLRDRGVHRMQDGYVREVASGHAVAVYDERHFFELCGEPWREPSERFQ